MSFDGSDKTIFRQPDQGDRTIVKPVPGGGRRNSARMMPPQVPPIAASAFNSGRTQHTASASPYIQSTHSLNILVDSASVLISVFETTRKSLGHPNIEGLFQRLITEIKMFENRVSERGCKPEIVLAARYLLCAVLDEAVLNTPWGAESNWSQRTLLSTFHNETAGGEKFFLILDRLRTSPMESLDILELAYICLSLGFEGQYKLSHHGRDTLEQIRADLFGIIRLYRGEHERSLSPAWQGLGHIRNSLTSYIPMWVVLVSAGMILLLAYSGFKYGLSLSSEPLVKYLIDISKKTITSVP